MRSGSDYTSVGDSKGMKTWRFRRLQLKGTNICSSMDFDDFFFHFRLYQNKKKITFRGHLFEFQQTV